MLHLPDALCMVSRGPALLDTEGRAQLFYQGGCEAHPSITQQLSGFSEDCYEALVEHLHNHLGHLVLHYHCKGIPREMIGHHKLQWSICSNQTEGSPWHFSLKCLAVWASHHYGSAILHHHGPPESLLSESQGPLLALMAGISVYPIKCHAALSHRDDKG